MVWDVVPLGQLCDFKNGLWKGKKEPFVKVGVIRNTNFSTNGTLDDSDIAYLDVEENQYQSRKLEFGDLILEKSGGGPKQPVGRVVVFEKGSGEFSFSNFTSIIRIKNKSLLEHSFLHRYLHFLYEIGATEPLQRQSTGIRNLQLQEYKLLKVPIPPIPEQKRIVAILDQAFADIDKARALTEQNLKNARELFESYLQQVFTQRGEGWNLESLENLVTSDCSLSYGIVQPGDDFEGGLPVVRPTDLTKEVIDPNGLKLINPSVADGYIRTVLRGGELLVCVRGSTGTTSIASEKLAGANVTRGIVPVRFDPEKVSQKFGFYQFKATLIQAQIRARTYGAALMQINIRDLRKLEIAVPSLSIQNEIVDKLDRVKPDLEKVEKIYASKLNEFGELKKSLLQKAFSGELTKGDTEVAA